VDSLLNQPDLTAPIGLRDKAMLELLYATGLRVSELVGLRIPDINLERGFLIVMGKGSKERAVPIGEVAITAIKQYLAGARQTLLNGKDSGLLFISSKRRGITRQMFWGKDQILYCKGGHRKEHFSPHAAPFLCDPPARQWRDLRAVQVCSDIRIFLQRRSTPTFPGAAQADPREIPPRG
jgi:integrase/recombinase XerD